MTTTFPKGNQAKRLASLMLRCGVWLQDLQSRLGEAQEAQQALKVSRAEAARLREEAAAAGASAAEVADGLRVSHRCLFHLSAL